MSFMAGLAEGFGKTFNAMEERRGAMKQDAFRIAYDSYLKKQAKYAEDEKQDSQWVATAKQIASDYRAPPEAWEHAYTMLKEGSSYEQAAERFGRTKFSKIATPAMGEDLAGMVPYANGMTEAAGLTMQQNPATDAALDLTQPNAEENPDILGSMTSAVGDIFNPDKIRERQMGQANKAVMSAAGVDQEEFDKYNQGYNGAELQGGYKVDGVEPKNTGANAFDGDPGKMPFAMLNDGSLLSGVQTPDGTGFQEFGSNRIIPMSDVKKIMSPAHYAAYEKAGGEADALTKDYVSARSDTISMVSEIKGLSQMAADNPVVLAKTSLISTAFNEIENELNAVFSQIGGMSAEQVKAEEEKAVAAVSARLQANGDMMASDAQAFAARAVGVKFKVARLLNGSGQLTNRDVQEAANLVLSSNDPKIFLRNAKIVAADLSNAMDVKAEGLSGQFAIKNATSLGAFDGKSLAKMKDSMPAEDYEWLTAKEEMSSAETQDPTAQSTTVKWEGNVDEAKADAIPSLKPYVGKRVQIMADGTVKPL